MSETILFIAENFDALFRLALFVLFAFAVSAVVVGAVEVIAS